MGLGRGSGSEALKTSLSQHWEQGGAWGRQIKSSFFFFVHHILETESHRVAQISYEMAIFLHPSPHNAFTCNGDSAVSQSVVYPVFKIWVCSRNRGRATAEAALTYTENPSLSKCFYSTTLEQLSGEHQYALIKVSFVLFQKLFKTLMGF